MYRYRFNRGIFLGISNTLSYTDLMLLDNEGDALPMDQFESLSDQIRVFGIYRSSSSLRFELGAFYRHFNVKEVGSESSLDFRETGGDLSSRHRLSEAWSAKIRYRIKDIAYSKRQANNRETSFDASFDSTNPALRLWRHDLDVKFSFDKSLGLKADVTAKYRINHDRFENDLSYRQSELRAEFFPRHAFCKHRSRALLLESKLFRAKKRPRIRSEIDRVIL